MRWIGGLLLVAYCVLTAQRLPVWTSDLDLWRAAVVTTPQLPRPALNYGMALIKTGQHEAGAQMFLKAARLAHQRHGPRDEEVLVLVRHGAEWLEIFGHPVCGRPEFAPFCYEH